MITAKIKFNQSSTYGEEKVLKKLSANQKLLFSMVGILDVGYVRNT